MSPDSPAPRLIVMGPSGSGKTTLARALSRSLGLRFVEGDELHPPENVQKMRAGRPLDDVDRAPWLDAVAGALSLHAGLGVVAACSALKRCYRDRLRAAAGPLLFIFPSVPRAGLAQRMATRSGHYMPATLLDSQLTDLEPLQDDEAGFSIDGTCGLSAQVDQVRSRLGL